MSELKDLENDLNVEKNFRHVPYSEKINKAYEELFDTDPTKVIKRGRKERDDYL
jgi:hypothetical protein